MPSDLFYFNLLHLSFKCKHAVCKYCAISLLLCYCAWGREIIRKGFLRDDRSFLRAISLNKHRIFPKLVLFFEMTCACSAGAASDLRVGFISHSALFGEPRMPDARLSSSSVSLCVILLKYSSPSGSHSCPIFITKLKQQHGVPCGGIKSDFIKYPPIPRLLVIQLTGIGATCLSVNVPCVAHIELTFRSKPITILTSASLTFNLNIKLFCFFFCISS